MAVNNANRGRRVVQISLGYSSWYWVQRPDDPDRARFGQRNGLLIRGGTKKQCVGVDFTDRTAVQWVEQASDAQLQHVRTAKVGARETIDQLNRLKKLEALECSGIKRSELKWICDTDFPLRCLHLSWVEDIADISPVGNCPHLLRLTITDCEQLQDIGAVQNLSELRRLEMINCDGVWEIDPVAGAKKLRRLLLRNCENIHALNPVAMLPNLRQLDLSRCTKVKELASLRKVKTLVSLDLSNCPRIHNVAPLQELKNLRILRLFGCNGIRDVRPVFQLPQLRKISLPNKINNEELLSLCIAFDDLVQMDLRNCETVTDISPVKRLVDIEELSLAGCRNIGDITPLQALEKLKHLDLAYCIKITDLSPLQDLTNLKNLYLDGCSGVDRDDVTELQEALPDCTIHFNG
ncbi:MAG: leucine-rich repeat domain-containing protein [Candidatus Brocadiia bacterium]